MPGLPGRLPGLVQTDEGGGGVGVGGYVRTAAFLVPLGQISLEGPRLSTAVCGAATLEVILTLGDGLNPKTFAEKAAMTGYDAKNPPRRWEFVP